MRCGTMTLSTVPIVSKPSSRKLSFGIIFRFISSAPVFVRMYFLLSVSAAARFGHLYSEHQLLFQSIYMCFLLCTFEFVDNNFVFFSLYCRSHGDENGSRVDWADRHYFISFITGKCNVPENTVSTASCD